MACNCMSPNDSHMPRARWIVSVVIGLAVVGVALFYRESLILTLRSVQPLWVMAGFGAYLLNYGFRAMRIKALSPVSIRFWPEGVHSAALHGFATYILPIRSGDLALPFILKSMIKLDLKDGIPLLFKARLLDVVTLGGWVFAAAVCWPNVFPDYLHKMLCGIALLMIFAPLLLKTCLKGVTFLGEGVRRRVTQLHRIGMLRPIEIVMSICIWSALGLCFYCIARAVGLSIEFGVIWLLIVVQLPLQLIPIQGLANAGNHEGGWVAALMLVGVSAETAIEFALASHVVLLVYVLLMGSIAMISGHFCHNKAATECIDRPF